MNASNSVTLCGRLTKDPAIRVSQSGKSSVTFTLAVQRVFAKNGVKEADFIMCVAFGKTAELIDKHCRKGTMLLTHGEWHVDRFTDRNGNTQYTNQMTVESISFVSNKSDNQAAPQDPAPDQTAQEPDFMEVPEGLETELPFV